MEVMNIKEFLEENTADIEEIKDLVNALNELKRDAQRFQKKLFLIDKLGLPEEEAKEAKNSAKETINQVVQAYYILSNVLQNLAGRN